MKIYLVRHAYSCDYEGGDNTLVGVYSSLELAKKHLETLFQKLTFKCREHNDELLKYGFNPTWKISDDDWLNEGHTALSASGMGDYDNDNYYISELDVDSLFNEKDVESEIEAHFY